MTFDTIAKIIAEKLDMNVNDISLKTSFEGMQVDSLDMVEIMLALEEEFNIVIEDASGLDTVADLVEYVEAQATAL